MTVRGVGFRIDPDGTFGEPPPTGARDADDAGHRLTPAGGALSRSGR